MEEAIGRAMQGAAMGATKAASREQYWEECAIEQKLERLRDVVARVCRETVLLSASVQRLAAHQHADNGGLLIPLHYVDQSVNLAGAAMGGRMYAHDGGSPHSLRTERERR